MQMRKNIFRLNINEIFVHIGFICNDRRIICYIVMLMIWVCHLQHHVVWQISQFAKSIHNSSPISLSSWCRLLCYPREDRCESKALWDPDGTFPTIRFGLPLENDPFPVCDTNVSLSASNEMKPANEKKKPQIHFLFAAKSECFTLVACESCNKPHAHGDLMWRNDCGKAKNSVVMVLP